MQSTTTNTPGGQSEYSTSSGEEDIVMTTTTTQIIGATPVQGSRIRPVPQPQMTPQQSEVGEIIRGRKTFVGSTMLIEDEEKEDL